MTPETVAPDETQRWRNRREYRVRGGDFRPGDYGVELVDYQPAYDFVVGHHYSASWPSTSVRVGLYRSRGPVLAPELVGVATFGTGVSQRSIPRWCPDLTAADGLQLGRFVLLDGCPFNAETWFLRRAFELLRQMRPELRVVLSYSDPIARRDRDGRVVMPGHAGAIYQAKGARWVGYSDPDVKWLDGKGCLLEERSWSKVRALDGTDPAKSKGGESFARSLVQLGAPPRRRHETWHAWVARIRDGGEAGFTSFKHPGNIAYLFGPDGRAYTGRVADDAASPGRPYPKLRDVQREAA